jgi:hypothetical protein
MQLLNAQLVNAIQVRDNVLLFLVTNEQKTLSLNFALKDQTQFNEIQSAIFENVKIDINDQGNVSLLQYDRPQTH